MCQYDLRAGAASPLGASLAHPATPSCVALAPTQAHQLVTGAYDGVARLWDLRSTKAAVAAFRAWEGRKDAGGRKVLGVDWKGGLLGVAGEGGVEVWKVAEGERVAIGN